jgi:hypothetical protein
MHSKVYMYVFIYVCNVMFVRTYVRISILYVGTVCMQACIYVTYACNVCSIYLYVYIHIHIRIWSL